MFYAFLTFTVLALFANVCTYALRDETLQEFVKKRDVTCDKFPFFRRWNYEFKERQILWRFKQSCLQFSGI